MADHSTDLRNRGVAVLSDLRIARSGGVVPKPPVPIDLVLDRAPRLVLDTNQVVRKSGASAVQLKVYVQHDDGARPLVGTLQVTREQWEAIRDRMEKEFGELAAIERR